MRKITRENLKKFLAEHRTDKKVLDIGAGEGAYAEFFPNRTALDVVERKGVDVVGDAHALPFEDGEFQIVLCTEVLEHLHTPEDAVSEMFRVLKPGGKVILTTRFIFPLHDTPHDYFRYTKYGLEHLFRDFKDIEIKEETDSYGAIAVLVQTLANNSNLRGGIFARTLLLLTAQVIRRFNWISEEEFVGGRNEEKRSERPLLTSGYYLTARK